MVRPVVQTNSGDLQGNERVHQTNGKKFYSFKGIPYAEPPLGDLRFKSPVPVTPWTGIKDASTEGNRSPQINTMMNFQVTGDEDCLYLNVYTPYLPSCNKKPCPVMVFIHGGGFRMGSGDEDEFGPDFLIEQNTILVTINHRLGVFGFLCLDTPDVPGNAGLKDQQLALKWIKNNIKYFGGDDNNITLFGISAGAAAVEYHLLNTKSDGLICKAIAQCGSALCPWALNRDPKLYLKKFTNNLGISEDDPNEIFKKLNELKVKDLLIAAHEATDMEVKKTGVLFGFGPVVEKTFEGVQGFLIEDPYELLKSGKYLKIPTIYSISRDEGSMFTYFYDKHTDKMMERHYSEYMSHLKIKNSKDINDKLTSVYIESSNNERKQLHNFLSDLMFASPLLTSLKLRSGRNDCKIYCYLFSYLGNLRIDPSAVGFDGSDETQHGAELPYLAPTKDLKPMEDKLTENDRRVRKWIVDIFTNFAKTGNPIPPDLQTTLDWKPMNGENLEILEIDTTLKLIPFPWKERMDTWDTLYE